MASAKLFFAALYLHLAVSIAAPVLDILSTALLLKRTAGEETPPQ